MKHFINVTPKGYVIYVYDKSKRVKYFLKDETHTMEEHIFDIIVNNKFTLGKPFGDNIYPIYLHMNRNLLPSHNHKTSAIWHYYRNLVLQKDKPKYIKMYAEEMRSKLLSIGVDALYDYVQRETLLSCI